MRKGFTLVEMLVVVAIFSALFAAILTVLAASDRSWRVGRNKLIVQQEARKAMDNIARALRQSRPEWVTILPSECEDRKKILIYKPVFDGAGEIIDTRWVIFKPDPDNCSILLRKEEEDADWKPVATEIEAINFSGGDCPGCGCDFSLSACSGCVNVTDSCPAVKVDIKAKKEIEFNLSSFLTLRNYDMVIGQVPEPPEEGEFF